MHYVHFGCGLAAPSGWRNFDVSPTLRLQRIPLLGPVFRRPPLPAWPASVEYGDIVRGLPVAPGSARGVYCSHVLEHLSLNDLRTALVNVRRVLAAGGRFRLVLPDLAFLMREYFDRPGPDAAPRFMRESILGVESRPRGVPAILQAWLGNSRHLWLWDEESLRHELERAGFHAVRRAELGDSDDPRFAEVEDPARWLNALGMEAAA